MGAKQSKRSVDISGKEAEGGGEVAVAGAGGEGRVEQLADADALKPQLNGDAHIQHEQTDKEKELDSGTPENEKDATTEKEGKEEEDKEKEAAPVTNGETEPKVENGESTPTPEDGKKPKKEKVKKKWSLRSISFSRKDKPKHEKKQKEEEPKTNGEPERVPEEEPKTNGEPERVPEEEPKTNGEPERVPEETAEATPEAAVNEVAEEAKALVEEKEEKTPETPVTEPLTNGTSSPQTPDTPEQAPAERTEPEQLPLNGLSIEEPKAETPKVEIPEETKPDPPAAEVVEIVPAPEIPKEVCVERMPLLEPTPPPLPANPPPSSVASFAATTMAPELPDASLANPTAPLALPDARDDLAQHEPPPAVTVNETLRNELPSVLKETSEGAPAVVLDDEPEIKDAPEAAIVNDVILPPRVDETSNVDNVNEAPEILTNIVVAETPEIVNEPVQAEVEVEAVKSEPIEVETPAMKTPEPVETSEVDCVKIVAPEIESEKIETPEIKPECETIVQAETINVQTETPIVQPEIKQIEEASIKAETVSQASAETAATESKLESENIPEPEADDSEGDGSLPPPPAHDDLETNLDDVDDDVAESLNQIPEPIEELSQFAATEHIIGEMVNGDRDVSPDEIIDAEKLKKKAVAPELVKAIECNGEAVESAGPEDAPASAEAPAQNGEAPPTAEPPAPHTPQEPLPMSDKLADLIPEIPEVPELNIETLQETGEKEVSVGN